MNKRVANFAEDDKWLMTTFGIRQPKNEDFYKV